MYKNDVLEEVILEINKIHINPNYSPSTYYEGKRIGISLCLDVIKRMLEHKEEKS